MGQNSSIEWTEATVNFWWGCTKVGMPGQATGCAHCYAETMAHRWGFDIWGPRKPRMIIPTAPALMDKLQRKAVKEGRRIKVFVQSMSDFFEEHDGPIIDRKGTVIHGVDLNRLRKDAFAVFDRCPDLDLQILTKRPENIVTMWDGRGVVHRHRDNVWLGTSIEHQEAANERIPHLLRAAHLCTYMFLSCEPLLGPLEFSDVTKRSDAVVQLGKRSIDGIDWVIVGGESGPNARPMHPDWARSLRDQCAAAGVAFLFKQWGEYGTNAINITTEQPVFRQFTSFDHWVGKADTWVRGGICLDRNGKQLRSGKDMMEARDTEAFPVTIMHKVGKHAAGRLLDGTEHNGFPDRQPEAVRA